MTDKPVSDAAYWNDAYLEGRDGWELGAPAAPIVRALGEVPVGSRAVVLGAGRGHEARAVAAAGWPKVVGLDFAPRAKLEAEKLTPATLAPRIEWRTADLFDLGKDPTERFDLAVEHTSFCAIDPARREEWLTAVARALKPGGLLLALFYAHQKPGGPPFATTRKEVEALLPRFGLDIERLEVAPDSHPRRAGEELLTLARRR